MLLHIFKMMWARKRTNSLIITEIAIAFGVVFLLATIALRYYTLYQLPLGFEYQDRWQIRMDSGKWQPDTDRETLKQLLTSIQQFPQVESAFLLDNPVFQDWSWTSSYDVEGYTVRFKANFIDDAAPQAMGVKLVKGRWFGPQDDGQNYNPVLVNKRFAEEVYPGQNPIGKNLGDPERPDAPERIVGVFEDFRQLGELREPYGYVFHRYDLDSSENEQDMSHIGIKVKPGTSVAFEKVLMKRLKGIAQDWQFGIKPWSQLRQSHIQETLVPLIIFGIVGVFLITMVAMGLFGVLWQNVTRRTQEIGLRRALGATARSIHWQVILELLMISLLGIAIAFVLLVQVPILGIIPELNWSLFWQSITLSSFFMILLSILCAFYPGKVATEYQPAQALHYE